MSRKLLLMIAPLVAATACAPRATRISTETPPRLIGCSGFQTSLERVRIANRYRVMVRVDANGKVVPGSGVVNRSRSGPRSTAEYAQEARNMAETCTFEPATRNGVAVESRAQIGVAIPPVGT